MSRTPIANDADTGTPLSTDFVNYNQLSDGTERKVTISNLKLTKTPKTIQINSGGKIGTTAGWDITGDNGYIADLPAGQTASTLIIPVVGLVDGDEITAYSIRGVVTSAGNTVTVDSDLIKLQANSNGTQTETTIGSTSQVSETSTDRFGQEDSSITGTNTVSNYISYYIIVTATTAASTTVNLNSVTVTVNGS